MAYEEMDSSTNRRTFLQTTGALATASAMSLAPTASAQDAAAKTGAMPTRPLGKTGVNITLLDQGAVRSESLDRLFRAAFASGIRVFDTAKVYGTEPAFKKWFEQVPEIRKQIFLVTKDMPKGPGEMMKMVDERLASLGTDYIDLFLSTAWEMNTVLMMP